MACNNANFLVFEKCDYLGAFRVQKWLSEPKMNMVIANRYAKKMNTDYKSSIDTLIEKVLDRI